MATTPHAPLKFAVHRGVRLDEDNSDDELRWVTLGETRGGQLMIVVHTYVETAAGRVAIRIISARRPTNAKCGNTAKEPNHEGRI